MSWLAGLSLPSEQPGSRCARRGGSPSHVCPLIGSHWTDVQAGSEEVGDCTGWARIGTQASLTLSLCPCRRETGAPRKPRGQGLGPHTCKQALGRGVLQREQGCGGGGCPQAEGEHSLRRPRSGCFGQNAVSAVPGGATLGTSGEGCGSAHKGCVSRATHSLRSVFQRARAVGHFRLSQRSASASTTRFLSLHLQPVPLSLACLAHSYSVQGCQPLSSCPFPHFPAPRAVGNPCSNLTSVLDILRDLG